MAQRTQQAGKPFQPFLKVLDGKTTQLKNPWRRYFAKGIDSLIVTLICAPLFLIFETPFSGIGFNQPVSEGAYNVLMVLLFTLALIVYDSVLLATWGTTPGKNSMSLRVCNAQGRPLHWEQAITRSIWINGLLSLCSLIPLLPIILMVYQKQRLCRTGFTSWDAPEEVLVYRVSP
ncbi:RDD family protein [Vampirovibrio sp.]|uniref:RDD family protein n=1 Tax=Vampirovibrio sp. TaxID=2717857 RepID=UPI00359396F9